MPSTLVRRAALCVLPLALMATACSSSSGGNDKAKGGDTKTVPAALTSYFPGTKASGTSVKVGLINPEGGTLTDQPEDREAADAARQYANEQLGGLGGHPVDFVVCKEAEDPASARDCANQMVEAKVAAVIVTTTAQGDAMAPIITKAGIPYVTAAGASPSEIANPAAFAWTGGFPGTLVSMAKYAAGKGYKKVNAFVTNAPAVVGGVKQIGDPTFKAAGMTLTVTPIPIGAADATPQVSAALKGNPDANIVVGDSTVCIGVLKALSTLGSKAARLLIQPCIDQKVVDAVGTGLDGSNVFTPFDGTSDDPEAQLYRYVMDRYSAGTSTSGYAAIGYEGALTLFRMAKAVTGNPTAASVMSAIKAASDVPVAAAHGIKATCNQKQFPQLVSICSQGGIVSVVQGGKPTSTTVIP